MQTNKKIKLLVVSSYERPCGIAQYVEHLEIALRNIPDLEVTIASLPVDILRSDDLLARRKSKVIIDKICRQCREADVVSIQFEHGLFGKSPFTIFRRLKKIIKASKRVIVTHHTGMAIKMNVRPSLSSLKLLVRNFKRNYVITRLLKLGNKRNNVYHIVPTFDDKANMVLYGQTKENHIFVRPLSFITEQAKNTYKTADIKEQRVKYFGSDMEGQKLIGVFGFLGATKGIETAINALSCLPENYQLAIVGGLHPESVTPYKLEQNYITKLTTLIKEQKDIMNRVHFVGSVNNDEFNKLMNMCDMVAMPYAEVMQSSSGPAGIALDLGMPMLCSNNRCFKELEKFAVDCLVFCEISNHLEFARKAKLICERVTNNSEPNNEYRSKYNVETRAQLYRELCEK